MSDIKRIKPGPRMSQGVIHGKTLYCAGQVGEAGASVTRQTETALAALDAVLAEAGTDKTRLLQVTIWMADMADFAEMNAVWDAWIPADATPARATGEAKLATPVYTVEVIAIAALT
jgi:enamine deaminase RidA (YjgF/YER057c/UK114 family)